MTERETLRKLIDRALEVANDEGFCDEAQRIVDIIETEFLDDTHPAVAHAHAFVSRFDADEVRDWDEDRILLMLRRAFLAGWDTSVMKSADDAEALAEGYARAFPSGRTSDDDSCRHESYSETYGWRKCSECPHQWRVKPEYA